MIEYILSVAAAVAVHELGHLAVMRLLKIRVRRAKNSLWGIGISADKGSTSYSSELAISLAGSAANIILALLLRKNAELFRAFFAYGAFNLLPAGFLDGGDALRAFMLMLGVPTRAADTVVYCLTVLVTVSVWVLSVYLALKGMSASLLLTAFYMIKASFF